MGFKPGIVSSDYQSPFFRAPSNAQGKAHGVGVGGFGCREGSWVEAHARVHDRALKIRSS